MGVCPRRRSSPGSGPSRVGAEAARGAAAGQLQHPPTRASLRRPRLTPVPPGNFRPRRAAGRAGGRRPVAARPASSVRAPCGLGGSGGAAPPAGASAAAALPAQGGGSGSGAAAAPPAPGKALRSCGAAARARLPHRREGKKGWEGGREERGGGRKEAASVRQGSGHRCRGSRSSGIAQQLPGSPAARLDPGRGHSRRTAEGPGAPGVLLPLSIPPSIPPRLRCAPTAPPALPEREQLRGWSPRQSRARRSPSPTPERRAPTAERGCAPADAWSPNATCR